jgi:hypothetical protein
MVWKEKKRAVRYTALNKVLRLSWFKRLSYTKCLIDVYVIDIKTIYIIKAGTLENKVNSTDFLIFSITQII